MMVAVDMGTGKPVALARIDEKDRPALFASLERLKEELGVEVLVSEDFNSNATTADHLELDHQVCRFHYLRWVNRLLNRLQKQLDDDGTNSWTKRASCSRIYRPMVDESFTNFIARSSPHRAFVTNPCPPVPPAKTTDPLE